MNVERDTPPCRALLVEDEVLVALHVADLLAAAGCEVIGPALRLAEAMALAEAREPPAFALLDINLAGELSWPVARALAQRGVPFIFVTGYVGDHAGIPADLAGAPMLSKPLSEGDLLRAIAQWQPPARAAVPLSP